MAKRKYKNKWEPIIEKIFDKWDDGIPTWSYHDVIDEIIEKILSQSPSKEK